MANKKRGIGLRQWRKDGVGVAYEKRGIDLQKWRGSGKEVA